MFELDSREMALISIALDEKLTFYKNRRLEAKTEEFKEFIDTRIAELNEVNRKLGY